MTLGDMLLDTFIIIASLYAVYMKWVQPRVAGYFQGRAAAANGAKLWSDAASPTLMSLLQAPPAVQPVQPAPPPAPIEQPVTPGPAAPIPQNGYTDQETGYDADDYEDEDDDEEGGALTEVAALERPSFRSFMAQAHEAVAPPSGSSGSGG